MIQILKNTFWKSILLICYILYPFIAIYNHYLKASINRVLGKYCENNISRKGINLWIKGMGVFTEPNKIIIGDHCRIGENAYFHTSGGLNIGNNVIISRNVTIYTANHNFHSIEYLPYDNTEIKECVSIEDNVWIGMNVCILPGVIIHKNAIIGMGAIISKNIPENAIVVGNNRIIGYREKIKKYKMFGKEYPYA